MASPFYSYSRKGNPATIINDAASQNKQIVTRTFPEDLPKYYTLLTEYEWNNNISNAIRDALASAIDLGRTALGYNAIEKAGNPIKIKSGYRLPLPTHIIDGHEVQYDHSFNWLGLAGSIVNSAGLGVPGQALDATLGAFGYTLNNFKFVTLQAPQFRQYAFEWRLFPNSVAESIAIRDIYTNIKRGMSPPRKAGSWVFEFPNIFWLGFMPNSSYLVKFKPAVITSCQIDYQGGNPTPTFYSDTRAPEGIIMRLSFLELEYWHRANFDTADTSDDPFDTADWYKPVQ